MYIVIRNKYIIFYCSGAGKCCDARPIILPLKASLGNSLTAAA